MENKVLIKQFKNKAKKPVAGLTPEHAIYDKNGVRLDAKLGNINLQEFRDIQNEGLKALKEQAKESLEILKEYDHETIINNGTINNAADEEDITVRDNVLSFKDRTYTEGINEMGYVILRKNKSFKEQVTKYNTIYEIRYEFDLKGIEVTIPKGCILKFTGGKLKNGTLIGDNTIIDAMQVMLFDSTILKGSWNTSQIYAKWWKNTGDDICKSITAMTSNGDSYYVEFERNIVYHYTCQSIATQPELYKNNLYNFNGCQNIDVNLNGSTHIVNTNNAIGYSIFHIYNCKSASIYNGTLLGDRISHDYNTINSAHEFGYGIFARGEYININNVNISEFTGDAIYIGSDYDYINNVWTSILKGSTIKDCELHHCRRQGISYGSSLKSCVISVENTKIHHIGTYDNIPGTAPMSGIDIEAEYGPTDEHFNGTLSIKNSFITDCTAFSIVGSRHQKEQVILDNVYVTSALNIAKVKSAKIINSIYEQTQISSDQFYLENVDAWKFKMLLNADIVKTGLYINGKFEDCEFVEQSTQDINSFIWPTKSVTYRRCIFNGIMGSTEGSNTFPQIASGQSGLCGRKETPEILLYDCTLNNCSANFRSCKNVILHGCIFTDGVYGALDNAKITNCTFINVYRLGSKYHFPVSPTYIDCIITEDFSRPLAKSNSMIGGGNNDKGIKLIKSILNVSGDTSKIDVTEHIRCDAFASILIYNTGSLSLSRVNANNCLIKGCTESFEGTGTNNSYEIIN